MIFKTPYSIHFHLSLFFTGMFLEWNPYRIIATKQSMVQNLEITKYSFRALTAKSAPEERGSVRPRQFMSSRIKTLLSEGRDLAATLYCVLTWPKDLSLGSRLYCIIRT
jgi:hypothetical protein